MLRRLAGDFWPDFYGSRLRIGRLFKLSIWHILHTFSHGGKVVPSYEDLSLRFGMLCIHTQMENSSTGLAGLPGNS